MHMADALVSAKVGVAMLAVSGATLLFCSKKAGDKFDSLNIPLMGVLGAFVFAAQMINFSIPMTGSSGHISGGILLAALLGAHPAFIALSCVLIVQALFFADGGILALGCNIFNMAFFTCLIAYPLIFLPVVKRSSSKAAIFAASIAACVVSLQLGAFCVVLETMASNISELPFKTFVSLMQPIHLAIALVEGVLTGSVIVLIKGAKPEILDAGPAAFKVSKTSTVVCLAVATLAIGAGLSQIASGNPDGLEWSILKTSGSEETAKIESPAHRAIEKIQNGAAILPDYNLPDSESAAGTSLAGAAGAAMTFALIFAAAGLFAIPRKKKQA